MGYLANIIFGAVLIALASFFILTDAGSSICPNSIHVQVVIKFIVYFVGFVGIVLLARSFREGLTYCVRHCNWYTRNPLGGTIGMVVGMTVAMIILILIFAREELWLITPIILAMSAFGIVLGWFANKLTNKDENPFVDLAGVIGSLTIGVFLLIMIFAHDKVQVIFPMVVFMSLLGIVMAFLARNRLKA